MNIYEMREKLGNLIDGTQAEVNDFIEDQCDEWRSEIMNGDVCDIQYNVDQISSYGVQLDDLFGVLKTKLMGLVTQTDREEPKFFIGDLVKSLVLKSMEIRFGIVLALTPTNIGGYIMTVAFLDGTVDRVNQKDLNLIMRNEDLADLCVKKQTEDDQF